MCTFVLGTLPANSLLERLERGFFRFSKASAGGVASVLQTGELFGRMTSRYCDCGTALATAGVTEYVSARQRERIEHKLDRLRRKGWSRNRIERWLAQVDADQERHAKAKAEAATNEAREWCNAVDSLSVVVRQLSRGSREFPLGRLSAGSHGFRSGISFS